jgi:hypothetical protein
LYKLDEYKNYLIKRLSNQKERFKTKYDIYILNNVRVMNSFTFYHWRIIELLEEGKVDILNLNPKIVQELMNVILPNGDSLLNRLIMKNIL